MTLLTAHRILIGTAVAFFIYYGFWEFAGWRTTGAAGGLFRAVASLLAAGGLGVYLLTLRQKGGPGGRGGPGSGTGSCGGAR